MAAAPEAEATESELTERRRVGGVDGKGETEHGEDDARTSEVRPRLRAPLREERQKHRQRANHAHGGSEPVGDGDPRLYRHRECGVGRVAEIGTHHRKVEGEKRFGETLDDHQREENRMFSHAKCYD